MPSPNLLNQNPKRVEAIVEKHHLTFSAAAKLTIILTQTVFIVLLGLNANTVSKIGKLESQVRALETQLINKKDSLDSIEKVIDKTAMLKELQAQRPDFAERLKKAVELIPPQVTLTQASIKPTSMVIVTETATPLDAAILINSYFTNSLASQITLNNANLSTTTGKFITNMEVTFK